MELYVLDALYRRIAVVPPHVSAIWTERWRETGDFELVMKSTPATKQNLRIGTRLAMDQSYYVMEVETVEDDTADDGKKLLVIKGRSIEKIMDDRVAMGSLADLTTTPKWVIEDEPAEVARKIFHDICVLGTLDIADIIPFVNETSFLPSDTIPEPVDPIRIEMDPTTVYTAIKEICDIWDLGFRLVRQNDTAQLYFNIYTGSDRTSGQTILPAVIFSREMDNLQKVKELESAALAKNVAYVYSPAGTEVVYAGDVDPSVSGLERRVLVVNATDITDENPDVEAALIQRGMEELAKARAVQMLDCEISQFSQYQYGRDYFLGDLVEQRGETGNTNLMRVEEQIFVSDSEGERSYPSLVINTFVNTGSWLSMGTTEWDDMEDEEWDDMP